MDKQLPQETIKAIQEEAEQFGRTNADVVYGYKSAATLYAEQLEEVNDELSSWKKTAEQSQGLMLKKQAQLEEVRKEANDLNEWKEAAMKVFNDIDLQECSKVLNLPLGSNIAKFILPALTRHEAERKELELKTKQLREALEEIWHRCDNENETHEVIWRIANEALK